MAFSVETGTGSATSNSYASVAEADAFLADRGNATWAAAAQATKEQALVSASDYLDAGYPFSGTRSSTSQAMAWPRIGAYDTVDNVAVAPASVPAKVKKAAIILASKVVAGDILLTDDDRGGAIKSATVGSLSVTYMDSAPAGKVYGAVKFIAGLVVDNSNPLSGNLSGAGIGVDNSVGADNATPYFTQNEFTR